MKLRAFLPVLVLLLLGLLDGGGVFARSPSRSPSLSRTSPPINLTHIFEGEINKRGKPVGYHSRPGGKDSANARVTRIVDRPNRSGVYTAEVEIRSGSRWLSKRSTFYPDRMDRAAVIQAVLNAFKNRGSGSSEKFRGPSGQGFTIEGYYQNGRINTAYPIFTR
jgi:Bacterial EndoU nuclease